MKLPQRFPGRSTEEEAATFIKDQVSKPLVAFIAGQTAPPAENAWATAGAIISGGSGKAADKIAALNAAGVTMASTIAELGHTVKSVMGY